MKKILIIVPAYNEQKYIAHFLKSLLPIIKKLQDKPQVVVINDGSTDKTLEIIKQFQKKDKSIIILSHKKNKGKGATMRTGLQYAKKQNASVVIFMDGDCQHDPRHLPTFLESIEFFPVVFGYRKLARNTPLVRKIGNKIAGFIIQNIFGVKRKDILCGFIALRRNVFNQLNWSSDGYGVEAELSAIVGRKKIAYDEVLIRTIYLDKHKGVNLYHAFVIFLKVPYWHLKH